MAFVATFRLQQQGAAEVKAALQSTADAARKAGEATATAGKVGATATRQLAVGAEEATRDLGAMTAAAARAEAQTVALGRAQAGASGQVGNLVANFNDLGMMLAAGQNPLQLALQQGTQITQVIGPMGAGGAVRALGTAFLSMLSPINLVTIGGIALGASLVQALTDSGVAAESLTDRVKGLADATDQMRRISEMSLDDVIEKYGRLDERITRLIARQQGAALAQAMLEARQVTSDLGDEYGDLLTNFSAIENQAKGFAAQIAQGGMQAEAARAEIDALWRGFDLAATGAGVTTQQVEALRDAMLSVNSAQGFDAQAAALDRMLSVLDELGLSGSEWYGDILSAQDALEQARASAEALGDTDIAGSITAAADEAARLADNMSRVEGIRRDQARRRSAGTVFDPRDPRYDPVVAEAARLAAEPNRGRTQSSLSAVGAQSRSGASSARIETDAVASLVSRKSQELAIMRETDPVQREMIRNRELLSTATDAQRVQVEQVIAALEREKAVQAASDFFASGAADFLTSIVSGSASAEDALDGLIKKLIEAGIQALMLGEGPLAGILGTAGTSIIGTLFGGGGKGTGSLGLPMPFADGGAIHGAGGPREDRVPIWASPGEFMVNARATARNRAVLEYINAGGVIGRFADGGAVGGGSAAQGGGSGLSLQFAIDARGGNTAVANEVRAEMMRLMPEIERRAVAAVARARRQGRTA